MKYTHGVFYDNEMERLAFYFDELTKILYWPEGRIAQNGLTVKSIEYYNYTVVYLEEEN